MSIVLLLLCVAAALMQLAVLRDRSLPEHSLVEAFRYLRVAAYTITAVVAAYVLANGQALQPMPALALIMLALADTVSAGCKLFPTMIVPSKLPRS